MCERKSVCPLCRFDYGNFRVEKGVIVHRMPLSRRKREKADEAGDARAVSQSEEKARAELEDGEGEEPRSVIATETGHEDSIWPIGLSTPTLNDEPPLQLSELSSTRPGSTSKSTKSEDSCYGSLISSRRLSRKGSETPGR
jgi:hypothetical protein